MNIVMTVRMTTNSVGLARSATQALRVTDAVGPVASLETYKPAVVQMDHLGKDFVRIKNPRVARER
jgi:hypothetical protein